MTPPLSICIATLPERIEQFHRLVAFIRSQSTEVEIVSNAAPRGTMSIGAKRQWMNDHATGDYIVHLDDDDWISPTYVADILGAIGPGIDCVAGYELVEGLSGMPQFAMWTNKASRWEHGSVARSFGVSFVRTPGHKTPLRNVIARCVQYKDMGFGEDEQYSRELKASKRVKREVFVGKVMQHYRYIPKGRDQYA
jgi:glycosyltransferase involved in cell wall biosynthesis